jgi:hypothetical protein
VTVVLGVGLSSRATSTEVRDLVGALLRAHRLTISDVSAIATRQRFVDDPRLALGPPVVGFSDVALQRASPAPPARTVGIPARVAEAAARLAVPGEDVRVSAVERSPHATAALARPIEAER